MSYEYNKKNISKKVSLGGILTLLSLISLYTASVAPSGRLSLFFLSTLFTSIMIIESDIKSALTVFLASGILAFFIVPNKILVVFYVLFFGFYGILKYYIENINKAYIEWIIKLLVFNAMVYIIYMILIAIGFPKLSPEMPILVFIISVELIFILYDVIYSLFIGYYIKKLRKYLVK